MYEPFCVSLGNPYWDANDPIQAQARPAPRYRSIVKHIQDWTKIEFGGAFRDAGESIRHGIQGARDFWSCGIVSLNMIAHNLFRAPVYLHTERYKHRMELFLELLRARNEVSIVMMRKLLCYMM